MKRISVVIPALNAAGSIGAAISSLHSERDLIAEILVVDDGSIDGTAAIAIRAGLENDLPVKVVPVGGRDIGAARNAGLAGTNSPWVYFLDADDLHVEGGLRRMLEKAGEKPEANLIVGSYIRRVAGLAHLVEPWRDYAQSDGKTAGDFLADRLKAINIGIALIARAILTDIRFPECIAYEEDTLFWARLLMAAVVAAVDAPVMIYNLSRQRADDRLIRAGVVGFFAWRRALRALQNAGISDAILRKREGLMAIKLARINYFRGRLGIAARFLTLARSTPKDLTAAWRYRRYCLKIYLARSILRVKYASRRWHRSSSRSEPGMAPQGKSVMPAGLLPCETQARLEARDPRM